MLSKIAAISQKLPLYFGLDRGEFRAGKTQSHAHELIEESTKGAASIAEYLSYRYFDEEQQLFYNDGGYIGFMLKIPPIVGVDNSLLKNLQYFFNDEFPPSSFLQFLLVASHNVEGMLAKWMEARTNKQPILQKLTSKRAGFIRELASSFGNFDGRIARDYNIYVSFCQKADITLTNINKIQSFKERLTKKFSTLNLASETCTASDLIELCRELVQMDINPGSNKKGKYDKYNTIASQLLKPLERQKIEEDSIWHIDRSLRSKCYYARELPKEFSLNQMIGLLGSAENVSFGLASRFVISYAVASSLSKAEQAAISSKGDRVIHAAEQWYSRNDRNIKREAEEWKDVNDLAKNGGQFLTENFSIMITAPEGKIELAEQALISLYNILDFRLEVNRCLQLVSMLAMLPMQQGIFWESLKRFRLTRTCLSQEVMARLPIHAEWKGVAVSGVLLQARRGQLFNWNPFYRIASGNYNVAIFGPSGGGKSVFLQELVVSLASQTVRIFVLDIGQSFSNICQLLSGENIQFGRKAGLSLNPFASFYPEMSEEDKEEFLKCAKALLAIMCGIKEEDVLGSAELERALQEALIASEYRLDITGFAQYLARSNSSLLKRYGATLYPYSKEGLYGKYFSGGRAALFKSDITVFEFEEIKNDPKLLAIVLQILLMEITNQFLTGKRTQAFMIIVDEAWMLLDFAASFFAAFGRTVRKYGGSLVICVQNFMDLQKTIEHRTILENSTWTVMLKQDEKGLEAFKNSEAFKDMVPLIQSVSMVPGKYSEVLLYSTGIKVVGRLVLDDYSKALYSTDAADFAYLRTEAMLGKNLDEAIESLALKNKRKSR